MTNEELDQALSLYHAKVGVKKCPFCRGDDIKLLDIPSIGLVVSCACGAAMCTGLVPCPSNAQDAADQWNHRVVAR